MEARLKALEGLWERGEAQENGECRSWAHSAWHGLNCRPSRLLRPRSVPAPLSCVRKGEGGQRLGHFSTAARWTAVTARLECF
jgi:hypothetical protein